MYVTLRRKNLQTDLLSSYDDDDGDESRRKFPKDDADVSKARESLE